MRIPPHIHTQNISQQGSSHLPPPTAHNRAEARKEVNGQSMLGTNYIACCGKRGRNKIGTRHHSNMMPERPPNARKTDVSSQEYRDENSCRPIGIVLRSSRSAAHQPKNRGEKQLFSPKDFLPGPASYRRSLTFLAPSSAAFGTLTPTCRGNR